MIQIVQPTRKSIIGRAKHIRAEIQQIFDDVAHWNSICPDHEHINADPDGRMHRQMCALDQFLAAEAAKDCAIPTPPTAQESKP